MTIPTIHATTIRETYNELLPIFDTRARKLQNNTYVRLDGSDIVIRYHATDILTYHGDDTVTINTDGWHTSTTSDRFRNWLPRMWSVGNDRGVWNVWGPVPGEHIEYTPFASMYPATTYPRTAAHFRLWDGMTITDVPRPRVVNYRQSPDFETSDKLASQIEHAIDRYADLYTAEVCADLVRGDQPISLAGDCFFCMGGIGDTGHLLAHLAEGYVMLSVVRNAYALRGYRDPGFIAYVEMTNGRGAQRVRGMIRKYLAVQLVPNGMPAVTESDLDYATAEVA